MRRADGRGGAKARLYGLGTALPPHKAGQPEVRRFMASLAEATLKGRRRAVTLDFLGKIYDFSGIAKRHSVLADYTKDAPEDFEFYPPNWALEPFPPTAARMRLFLRFLELNAGIYGEEHGLARARKLVGYWLKGLPGAAGARGAFMTLKTLKEAEALLIQYTEES